MLIEKSGSDDFEAAWAELLDALQQQRVDLLGGSIGIHVGIGLLAGAEADRLAAKYGEDDTRVQIMRDRSEAATARVDALSVEQEIAMVRTPPPPPATGALIQGRVTDLMKRTAGQVTVQVVDEKGQAVAGIAPVETDAAGYFAFEFTPEIVKATAQSKLSVLVRAADVQLVPAAAEPVVVAAGATRVMEVSLSAAELEKLRLRIPAAAEKVAAEARAAAEKKAEEEKKAAEEEKAAAARKAEAEKAAEERAAEEKRAAEKEKAEKDKVERWPFPLRMEKAAKAAEEKAAKEKAAAEAAAVKAADKKSSDKAATEEKPDPAKPATTDKKR